MIRDGRRRRVLTDAGAVVIRRSLRLAGDAICDVSNIGYHNEEGTARRLSLPPQLKRLDRLRLDCPSTSRNVGSPINMSPEEAACPNLAATSTASPVASRSSVPVTTSPEVSTARTASGSVDSPNAVDPVTSQNNTVTVFRSSRFPSVRGDDS
jgi:hypothetical protein